MSVLQIGLIGFGTVGSAAARLLLAQQQAIALRTGHTLHLKRIAALQEKPRTWIPEGIALETGPAAVQSIVHDPSLDLIIEAIGGTTTAKEVVLTALKQGKLVVTANKALLATCGMEILHCAQEQAMPLGFEAAVAGGIPIIKSIKEGLIANQIQHIVGIINGTCNYILSCMQEKGLSYMQALEQAQQKGYAEAKPEFDVEGVDASHKIAILAALAFSCALDSTKVAVEGITAIKPMDFRYAAQLGFTIKHLGIAKKHSDGIELRVNPALLSTQTLLAHVNGINNALWVHATPVGETLYYGAGAGGDATSSAIVSDVVDVITKKNSWPIGVPVHALKPLNVRSMQELRTTYYLRVMAKDEPGVLAAVTQALAEQEISVQSLVQYAHDAIDTFVPLVLLTHQTSEKQIQAALAVIKNSKLVSQLLLLRVEELTA